MNQENTATDLNYDQNNKPKLPVGLNVLTILTFIWSAYELYSGLKNFFGGREALDEIEKAQEKLENAPSWAKKMAGPEVQEMMSKAIDNKVPLLIISLVSIALCVWGAIEMRKFKKQGYTFWLIGEVLPYVCMAIFVPVFFKTVFAYFIVVPLIFIILYSMQRKHLKY